MGSKHSKRQNGNESHKYFDTNKSESSSILKTTTPSPENEHSIDELSSPISSGNKSIQNLRNINTQNSSNNKFESKPPSKNIVVSHLPFSEKSSKQIKNLRESNSEIQNNISVETFLDTKSSFERNQDTNSKKNKILNDQEKDKFIELEIIDNLKSNIYQLILKQHKLRTNHVEYIPQSLQIANIQLEIDFETIKNYIEYRNSIGKLASGRIQRWYYKINSDVEAQNIELALLKVRKTVLEIERKQQRRHNQYMNNFKDIEKSSQYNSNDSTLINIPSQIQDTMISYQEDIQKQFNNSKQLFIPKKLSILSSTNLNTKEELQNSFIIEESQINTEDKSEVDENNLLQKNFKENRLNTNNHSGKIFSNTTESLNLFNNNFDDNDENINDLISHQDVANSSIRTRKTRSRRKVLIDELSGNESSFISNNFITNHNSSKLNIINHPKNGNINKDLFNKGELIKIEDNESIESLNNSINNIDIFSDKMQITNNFDKSKSLNELDNLILALNAKANSSTIKELEYKIEIEKDTQQSKQLNIFKLQLAAQYLALQDYDKSIETFNYILSTISIDYDTNLYIITLIGLSSAMKSTGKLRKSKSILERRILKDLFKNDYQHIPSNLRHELFGLLGQICLDLNQEQKARKYFNLQTN